MFESLTTRLTGVFDRLKRRGALSESDVTDAMREIRVALLEADVALPVVKDFVARVRERAVGQEVVKSITPGQMVVKIVHDELVAVLGGEAGELALGSPPAVVVMAGLQGSGKTTTSAKLARRLRLKERRKVLLASLDTHRPAAQTQLEVLARQCEVASLPIVPGQGALDIARRALETARREGFDVLTVDTAGRLSVDDALMRELAEVRDLARPRETLLVADALTGQDAVNTARIFHERIGITGIVLTRMDGDARGGAALSMRHVTGQPIKLVGTGEKLDALEPFHPDRLAGRILQQGDILSLVEKAQTAVDEKEAERLAKKVTSKKGLDLEDFLGAMRQMQKMGPLKNVLGLLPGMNPAMLQAAKIDDKKMKQVEAIVLSMTPKERANPDIINGQRRLRIAKGSGRSVQEVNVLLNQFKQMQKVMKTVGKTGGMGGLKLPFGRGPFPG
jgi:signal recognition particle subunit SRP54